MNKTGTQRLETHRLILRRYRTEDAEDMFSNWASDPEVTRFLTWPPHKSIDVTRFVLNDWIAKYDDGRFFHWAIELKETGEPIGCIGYLLKGESNIDIGENEAEAGYWIAKPYWNKGICTDALKLMIDYCFNEKHIDVL